MYDVDINEDDSAWLAVRGGDPLLPDCELIAVAGNFYCRQELPAVGQMFALQTHEPAGFSIRESGLLTSIVNSSSLLRSGCGFGHYLKLDQIYRSRRADRKRQAKYALQQSQISRLVEAAEANGGKLLLTPATIARQLRMKKCEVIRLLKQSHFEPRVVPMKNDPAIIAAIQNVIQEAGLQQVTLSKIEEGLQQVGLK